MGPMQWQAASNTLSGAVFEDGMLRPAAQTRPWEHKTRLRTLARSATLWSLRNLS